MRGGADASKLWVISVGQHAEVIWGVRAGGTFRGCAWFFEAVYGGGGRS